jgi:hypothetical protein
MNSRVHVWLPIAVASLAFLATGCSPTGWAVREIPDGSDLEPGETVMVTQRDGSTITGEFVGTATIPSWEYMLQYERATASSFDGKVLPAIGQTIQFTTAVSETKYWSGRLAGFDIENVWILFPGEQKPEPVYFCSIRCLSDANDRAIPCMMLRNLFLSGDIPLMSALKFKQTNGEVSVPISSISELAVLDSGGTYTSMNGKALRRTFLRD